MTAKQFAALAREVFGHRGWQTAAAKFFGVSQPAVWQWVNDKHHIIPPDRADRLRREAKAKIERVRAALAA